ncbi:class I SAM-dependent methyltransferase [Lysobacter niabensis]
MTPVPWPEFGSDADWVAMRDSVLTEERRAIASADGRVAGHCVLCNEARTFAENAAGINFREGLLCPRCHANARQRAAASVLSDARPHLRYDRVYLTEQASALFLVLRRHVGQLLGSEFTAGLRRRLGLSFWLLRHGCLRAWIRHEDITALRLPSASVDAIVSLDVLEHVPDYTRALGEFARVLAPGGTLVLTVPFHEWQADSQVIARVRSDGSVETVGEPEFHGDPVSGGSLCFHHFGWDLLQSLRDAGFGQVVAVRVQDLALGLPGGIWVLRATR